MGKTVMVVLINPTPNIPYNLMYIASYLRKFGVKCMIQNDANLYPNPNLGLYLKSPDVVGISDMFSCNHKQVMKMAEKVKRIHPKSKIVLGGNHASSFAEDIIKNDFIDHVVVGEGEQAMFDIVRGCKEKIVKRPMLNIDDIPMPAYDLVDIEGYFKRGRNPFSMRKRTMAIISSRGCPNNCKYCSIGAVWGRTWRGRSPKLVVDEIEYLQKKYNVHEFSFLDDSISVNPDRLFNLCAELFHRKIKIKWTTPNGIAYWTLTKQLLCYMATTGCYKITFGIESGNDTIRSFVGKPYSLGKATELIKYANWLGMWTVTTNIIGLPYESKEDIEDTVNYAINCDTDFACFYKLILHKNTALYKDKEKIQFSDEELTKIQRKAYRRFLLSRLPTALFRLLNKVRSWEDFRYVIRLCILGGKILLNTFKKKGHILYD